MTSDKLRQLISYVREYGRILTHVVPDSYIELMEYLELQHYILVEKEKKTAALLREKHGAE
jgi:hypothetical protein